MIEFGKGYWITTDKYNFIILQEQKTKDGKKNFIEVSYHGTLEGLLKHLGQKFVRGVKNPEELKELKEALIEFNSICEKRGRAITINKLQKEYDKKRNEIANRLDGEKEKKKEK